jgi:hypothetical protein
MWHIWSFNKIIVNEKILLRYFRGNPRIKRNLYRLDRPSVSIKYFADAKGKVLDVHNLQLKSVADMWSVVKVAI